MFQQPLGPLTSINLSIMGLIIDPIMQINRNSLKIGYLMAMFIHSTSFHRGNWSQNGFPSFSPWRILAESLDTALLVQNISGAQAVSQRRVLARTGPRMDRTSWAISWEFSWDSGIFLRIAWHWTSKTDILDIRIQMSHQASHFSGSQNMGHPVSPWLHQARPVPGSRLEAGGEAAGEASEAAHGPHPDGRILGGAWWNCFDMFRWSWCYMIIC